MSTRRWRWCGAAARWALLPALVAATLVLFPPWAGRITGRPNAGAQTPDDTPLAFYSYVPAGSASSGAWLTPLIRMLNAAGLVRAEDKPVADGLLIGTLLNGYPHRAALLDLQARRVRPGVMEVQRLKLIVEIDAAGQGAFESIRRSLETVLAHYGNPADIQQTVIELPEGKEGVRYRDAHWPAWLTLEWFADERQVMFGIGEGVLAQWMADGKSISDIAAGAAHRSARPADDSTGQRFLFEVFANLDGLRDAAPTLFATGRTTPLLRLFDLDRAGQWMLHGGMAGTFLMLDVTTEQEGCLAARQLTQAAWPAESGIPQPPGSIHVAAPIDWPAAVERVEQVVRLCHEPQDRPYFDDAMSSYEARAGTRATDLAADLQSWLLISDYPRSWLALPGTVTIYAPLRTDAAPEEARARFDQLMWPLVAAHTNLRGVGVAYDRAAGIYWVDSPMRALFKAPAWGWADYAGQPAAFVVSYSPQAIEENRRLIGLQSLPGAENHE